MYTIGELFAGIGGFSLAFHAAGMRTAWFVEKEPFCQQVLRKNFPGVPIHGDIYECHDLPYVDIITAGFPCQPFSQAGKRQGVNDERYLVPEMLRVISEVQPRVCIFENVPGFTNIAAGDTFKQFLRALAESGYDAEWDHFRASDRGAPHQRERWFCVAYRVGTERQTQRGYGMGTGKQAPPFARTGSMAHATGATRNLRYNVGSDGRTHQAQQNRLGGQALGNANQTGRGKQRRPLTVQPQFIATQYTGDRHELGNTQSGGRGGIARRRSIAQLADGHARDGWAAQRGLGRAAHGLSAWMDRPQWPARPGEPQHDYEPPRVTSAQPQRTARLKALGNSVVPQCVYPIACAVREWLDAQAAPEAGEVA